MQAEKAEATPVATIAVETPKSPLWSKVQEALDGIRPYLQADGGDAHIQNITDDNVVELKLVGACGSCPMSTMTLRAGVEQALKRAVPEITRVEALA
jgi:Fe-S cluster biogenesis protein NfuA